jgi:hypothetical protein
MLLLASCRLVKPDDSDRKFLSVWADRSELLIDGPDERPVNLGFWLRGSIEREDVIAAHSDASHPSVDRLPLSRVGRLRELRVVEHDANPFP